MQQLFRDTNTMIHTKSTRGFALAGVLLFSGCSQSADDGSSASGAASVQAADYVITNGKVYTVNDAQPWAEAVAVFDKKIVYVGDAAGAAAYQDENTEVIDVGGTMVLPGFISGHDHLIAADWLTFGVSLFDVAPKEAALQAIKDYADSHPDEKVIRGAGWNPVNLGGLPTAADLDSVVSDRPVILLDFTMHDGWLNSNAMAIGGIDKDTVDPAPGVTY